MSRSEDTPEYDSAGYWQDARLNEPDGHSPFPIGIGASTGGVEAFQQLLVTFRPQHGVFTCSIWTLRTIAI